MKNLRTVVSKKLRQYRRSPSFIEVIAGRADGMIYVPGTNKKKIFVKLGINGEVFAVWNKRSNPGKGDHLFIGETDFEPGIVQVLDSPIASGSSNNFGSNVTIHAPSHLLTGTDPVFISTYQILEGLVYAGTGMNLKINPGPVVVDGQPAEMVFTTIDLTSHIPASGAVYVLARANSSGVASIQDGTPVAAINDLLPSDIPAVASHYALLGWVRLHAGQTSLDRSYLDPDVTDARFAPNNGGGAVDASELTYTPLVLTDWDGDADPGNANSALDQLAERVDDLEASGGGADLFWNVDGMLDVGSSVALPIVVSKTFVIQSILVYVETLGSAGSTTVDIHKNGTTIFSTPPSVAYNDANNMVEVVPTTVDLAKNDILTLDIDAVATGARGLVVVLIAQANPETLYRQIMITVPGTLTITTGRLRIPNRTGVALAIMGVYLNIDTPPTDATVLVDVHKNGVTLFTTQANRPEIAMGANSGYSETIDITSWSNGDYLTVDIDQIGSTQPGADLVVTIAVLG